MRHPALTRFFAAFLAVVSAITLFSGGVCIKKAADSREKQNTTIARLAEKTAEAKALRAELDAMPEEFETKSAAYDEAKADYDGQKLSYRKDLAIYTATEAGLKQAQEQIDEGYAALRMGWIQHDNGEKALDEAEEQFLPGYEQYLEGKAQLEEGRRQYEQAEKLRQSLPDTALLRTALEAVRASRGEFSAAVAAMQSTIQDPPRDPDTGESDSAALRAQLLSQTETLAAGLESVRTKLADTYSPEELERAIAPAAEALREQTARLSDENLSAEELIASASAMISGAQGANVSLEDALDSAEETLTMLESLPAMKEQLDQAEAALQESEPAILQAKQGFEEGRQQLDAAKQMLIYAEAQLIAGTKELEEKQTEQESLKEDLDRRKDELERRSDRLETMLREVEEYREKKDHFSNLRYTLRADEGIAARERERGDLLAGAEEELAARRVSTQREYSLRLAAALLMIFAGFCGLLAVIAAFREKGRVVLLLGAAFAFASAAAAEGVSLYAARGVIYTVLFVGLFAAAVLLLNLKKAK